MGHNWHDFSASFEIKYTPDGQYQAPPQGSYEWVTPLPTDTQSGSTATGVVKLLVAGYWKITGSTSATYWSSPDGKEDDAPPEDIIGDSSSSDHDPNDSKGDAESDDVTAASVAIVAVADTQPTPNPTLPAGVLCLNAQSQYNEAKWKVTVKPKGTTAKVAKDDASKADVSVQSGSSVSDGDTVIVKGGSTPGTYKLKITHNKASKATKTSDPGTAFKFQYTILDHQHTQPQTIAYLKTQESLEQVKAYAWKDPFGATGPTASKSISITWFERGQVTTTPANSYSGTVSALIDSGAQQVGYLFTTGSTGIVSGGGVYTVTSNDLKWTGTLEISGANITPAAAITETFESAAPKFGSSGFSVGGFSG